MTAPAPAIPPRVGAVVVSYFPDAGFSQRLAAVAREAGPVLVVDNSAEDAMRAALRGICAAHHARLVENPENRGMGAALNQAFHILRDEGVEWAIAFDQDSTPEPGFAAALLAAAATSGPAAAVGANWRDEARPAFASRHLHRHAHLPLCFSRSAAHRDLRDVTCVITSGTLFHLPTAERIGLFDEGLFLDLVDTDFCLRARASGHALCVAAAAHLLHRRGAKRPIRVAGRTWWPAFMPPLRLFLLFRNRVLLIRRHGLRAPHWVFFELVYTAKVLAEILFFEDRKAARLGACLRGTWHGLLGRHGPPARVQP
ncbi:MAG TPA: glycosyltransferase [Opitutaceae bacterium]|nr:glycosyltransferase [Opitutaceae bacterium]